jgi:hypothetical protein
VLGAAAGIPFHLSADWFACWSAGFGPVIAAETLALRETHERIGPIKIPSLRSATNPHSAHYDAPPGTTLPRDLPARLFAGGGIGCIRFDYLPENATLLSAVRGWSADFPVRIAPHALTPVVDCRRPYDAWFATRSKRIRQRLRGHGKQVFGALGMTIEFRTDDPTQSDLFERMLDVEQSGWKGRGGTAIRDNPDELRFYIALVQRAAAAGALQVALLWHGDTLAAFEFGVIGEGRLFLLKVGYDERYADLSVGYLLAAEHIRHCCEQPAIHWYDKMGNGMHPAEYKLRFADHCDTLYRATIFAPGLRGTLLRGRDVARARAKAWRDRRREAAA